MTPVLEREELRQSLIAAGEDAEPRPDCPPPDQLWAAVQGELEGVAGRRIVDHVSRCPVCAEAWDLARDVGGVEAREGQENSESGTTVDRAPPVRRPAWRQVVPWAAAAALLVAVSLSWLGPGPVPPPLRSGAMVVSELPEGEGLPRQRCVLRWSGPEGVESYDLRLGWVTTEAAGEILERQGIPAVAGAAELQVPPESLEGVPPGADLLWQVSARRGGEVIDRRTFTAPLE